LFYDVNLLGQNVNSVKKNTTFLLNASQIVGLEINAEKNYVYFYISSLDCKIKVQY